MMFFILFVASVAAQCINKEKWEEITFPTMEDKFRLQQNSFLQGYVLAEHKSPNRFACFMKCVDNCRCLSFNFKSNVTQRNCHLNEAASYTNLESIDKKEGWSYIEMARSYLTEPSKQTCSRDICQNGCCQSSPCENGGSCREECDVKARRYKCACLPGYTGHRCDTTIRSCHDVLMAGNHKNGVYKVRYATNDIINVYCDFDSEPGAAWTLVQSYSLDKGRRGSNNDIFSKQSLHRDFPTNEGFPNDWSSYRLSKANMQFIRDQSTHWRATCNFPSAGVKFRDYARVSFDDVNVMRFGNKGCRRFEFINILGNQCINCTANLAVHQAPYVKICAKGFRGVSPCTMGYDLNLDPPSVKVFGVYDALIKTFSCSATENSTTQYWFGKL